MTECTLRYEPRKGKFFAAVQSEELLRDRAQLRNILKPFCSKQFHTVDGNAGMQRLYSEFDELAREVGTIVESILSEAKNSCINNDNLISIEQRLSKLQKAEKSVDRRQKSQRRRSLFSRFINTCFSFDKNISIFRKFFMFS
jgi:septal ring factor EnvC (AmiA/AmiB activator)